MPIMLAIRTMLLSSSSDTSACGMMTASMTWMIPLEVTMSTLVMFAPSIDELSVNVAFLPLTICKVIPSVMSVERTVPA